MVELRATDVVPIDVASKLALGVQDMVAELRTWPPRLRRHAQRVQLWAERQHLSPDQVLQLVVLVVYGLVTLAEVWAYRRKGR